MSRRPILFLVNDLASLKPGQSTYQLAQACARRGDTWISGIDGLAVPPEARARVYANRMTADGPGGEQATLDLTQAAVWVRLNPGRNPVRWATTYALEALSIAKRRGSAVHNDPTGLWSFLTKVSLMHLPAKARPTSFVSPDPARLAEWIRSRRGFSVIKPSLGTHGQGVRKVSSSQPDLDAILREACADGPMVAQSFLPRAPEGDVRVHMVNGEPLMANGRHCIVRRLPPEGDFRSNVSAGGTPGPAEWNDELEAIAKLCGPSLRKFGLFHVGIDVVGTKVVEVNAFSPGGLRDCGTFMGADFVEATVDAFEAKTL